MNDIIKELNRGIAEMTDVRLAEYLAKLDKENEASDRRYGKLVGAGDYTYGHDEGEAPLGAKW